MKFGIDRLLSDAGLRRPLEGRRIALVAHPASVTQDLAHSLDALAACPEIRLTAAFGPQHGLRGDKQDNMIESADCVDPLHGIPVFSLYGQVRRPTDAMMGTLYITLGILLLMAARNPSDHRSLIAYTAWSSVAHAAVMAIMAFQTASERDLLWGVAAFGAIGIVLIALAPRKRGQLRDPSPLPS